MSRGARSSMPCPTTAGEALAPSRSRYLDRGQSGLEPLAQVLELRRQHEALAQMLGILVDRESRPHRGDLEQHTARFTEVNRLEPEAVDDGGGLGAAGDYAIAPRHLLVIERGPRSVVDGSRSGNPTAIGGSWVEDVATPSLVAADLPRRGALRGKAERVLEELAASLRVRGVGTHLFEPLDGVFSGNLGVGGGERRVGGGDHAEFKAEPFGVGKLE